MRRLSMRRTVGTLVVVFAALGVSGCISIPDPGPVQSVSYEHDKDKQQWTKTRCVVNTKLGEKSHSVETVCRRELINAPPPGIEKQVAE
jgi:hypothetical protein